MWTASLISKQTQNRIIPSEWVQLLKHPQNIHPRTDPEKRGAVSKLSTITTCNFVPILTGNVDVDYMWLTQMDKSCRVLDCVDVGHCNTEQITSHVSLTHNTITFPSLLDGSLLCRKVGSTNCDISLLICSRSSFLIILIPVKYYITGSQKDAMIHTLYQETKG